MSDIDDILANLPPLLPASVARVKADGLPTKAQTDFDEYQSSYYKSNIVRTDQRITTVQSQTDANTASITEEVTARTSEDEALAEYILTVQAHVDDVSATVTETIVAYTSADSALAERIDSVEASSGSGLANGQIYFAAMSSPPTGATAAYGVYLTAGSAFTGLTLIAKSDGTSAIAFNAGQFTLDDSGTATNVFTYSGGIFTFNVPVVVRTQDIAANATFEYQETDYPAQTLATGLGARSGTLATWDVNGDAPMLLDVTCNLIMMFGAGSGNTSDFALIVEVGVVGSSFVRSIVSGIGTVSIDAVRKTGVAAGPRTISLKWTYNGNGAASQAKILAGSLSVFTLFKR